MGDYTGLFGYICYLTTIILDGERNTVKPVHIDTILKDSLGQFLTMRKKHPTLLCDSIGGSFKICINVWLQAHGFSEYMGSFEYNLT